MKKIDWKTIKFIARKNTWYDFGTEAKLLNPDDITHSNTSGLFDGIHNKRADEEFCSLFEFDWIDPDGNILNSNIPDMDYIQEKNHIVIDAETGERYNWLLNKKL